MPAPESPAERFDRDVERQGGDWSRAHLVNDAKGLHWEPNASGELEFAAHGELGSRVDRDYAHRGGDSYLDANGNVVLDPEGRSAREYANPTTLVSAVNDQVHEDAANFEGSPLA